MKLVCAAIAVAFFAGGSARANKEAIALSISPTVTTCRVGESLVLVVTVTNTSGVPEYLQGDLTRTLDYAVKNDSGAVVRRWNDPPLFPNNPRYASQRIWLKAGESIRFAQRLSLADLGINEPGEFTLVGVFGGSTKTEAELESEEDEMTIAYSETVKLSVKEPK